MATAKLRSFLDDRHVKYSVISHPPTYTAQETAQATHISGEELAKSVILMVDGRLAMVVQPASRRVSVDRLKAAVGASDVHLAQEYEFRNRFDDCEPGAMPPFGNLYGMDVYVDEPLTHDEQIAFNAGTHTEVIQMAYRDYADLVHPKVLAL